MSDLERCASPTDKAQLAACPSFPRPAPPPRGRGAEDRDTACRLELGHAGADGGGDLEARAAERRGEIEAVDPVHAAKDGVAVLAIAIEGAVSPRERGPLHGGDALGEDPRPHAGRVRREPRADGVRIDVPLLARHAHDGQDAALRPEVAARHVVDEDHVRIAELRRARHDRRVDGLGPRGQGKADLPAEPRRPRARRHHHRAGVDTAGAGLDAKDAALAPDDAGHRGPLEDAGAQLPGAPAEALDRVLRIGVAAVGLVRGGAEVRHVGEGLEVLELRGRDGDRVDADSAQHLHVLPEGVRVGRCHHVEEARMGEDRGPAHQLLPVREEREAGPRQPRVPLVRIVHADEGARPARGAARQRALLEQHDPLDPPGGQRVGDARSVDSTTDHDHVRRLSHRRSYLSGRAPPPLRSASGRGGDRKRREARRRGS